MFLKLGLLMTGGSLKLAAGDELNTHLLGWTKHTSIGAWPVIARELNFCWNICKKDFKSQAGMVMSNFERNKFYDKTFF